MSPSNLAPHRRNRGRRPPVYRQRTRSYQTTPVIDFDRVSDIVARRPIPIALHGGSGLTDEQFAGLIARGCAKVNISTALKELYMKSTLAYLVETEKKNKWDPPSLFRDTRAAVVAMVVDLAEQRAQGKRPRSCRR